MLFSRRISLMLQRIADRVRGESEAGETPPESGEDLPEEIRGVSEALTAAGLGPRVAFDLGEVRGLDYYTGLVFRVFAPGLGFEVGGGGRYDALLARFGRPLPAVGFMLGLDRVALLVDRQGGEESSAPAAESVAGPDLGAALRAARERRRTGTRVRFGNGGER
jgi:ATP phosphoribosyltransferase regulatory subunit